MFNYKNICLINYLINYNLKLKIKFMMNSITGFINGIQRLGNPNLVEAAS